MLQVNAAVDDAASMAEDVARLLSAARSKAKLSTAERKRAQALMISVAVSAPSQSACCVNLLRCGVSGEVSVACVLDGGAGSLWITMFTTFW